MTELNSTSALISAHQSVFTIRGFEMRERPGVAKIRIQAVRARHETGLCADPQRLPHAANASTGIDPAVLWKAPGDWIAYSLVQSADQLMLVLSQIISNVPLVMSDVSAGSVALDVTGALALEIFARDCTLDLEGDAVPVGACAQTLLAQVPVMIHRPTAAMWRLFVERSAATHVWERLIDTATHAHVAADAGLHLSNNPSQVTPAIHAKSVSSLRRTSA